jgi:hypothetical protein
MGETGAQQSGFQHSKGGQGAEAAAMSRDRPFRGSDRLLAPVNGNGRSCVLLLCNPAT